MVEIVFSVKVPVSLCSFYANNIHSRPPQVLKRPIILVKILVHLPLFIKNDWKKNEKGVCSLDKDLKSQQKMLGSNPD